MTTPCLTRQNAFLLEENERHTPLDVFCGICNETADNTTHLIQPCRCKIGDRPYLAHKLCFEKWSIRNGCPSFCTTCKARYNTRRYNCKKIYILIFVLIPILFSIYYIVCCTSIKTFTREEIIAEYGQDTFKDIPDQITLPVFSVKCFISSISKIPSFSTLCLITFISFILSFLTVNAAC